MQLVWVHWALGSAPNPDATVRSVGGDWAVRRRRVASSVACAPATGTRGALSSPLLSSTKQILGKCGALFFFAKAVTGGGDFAAPPAGMPRGAPRGFIHTEAQMRLDFLPWVDCSSTCAESHWGSVPPHDGGGARCVVASSPRPPPGERCPLFLLWLFLFGKMCCHRSRRRRRRGVLWARGVLKLRCESTFIGGELYDTCVESHQNSRPTPQR